MPDRYVYCGRLQAGGRPDALQLDVNAPSGSPRRVNLFIGDLEKRLADTIPNVLTDMLEIAAYIYCADQFTSRGTRLMTDMGANWRRQFRFKIPVRRPEVWNNGDVRDALIGTLSFLTEDDFDFEFVPAFAAAHLQAYLPFNSTSVRKIDPSAVLLFSGGLDSLAGAVDNLLGARKDIVLVSHQASTMLSSRQNALVASLRERSGLGRLFYVPVGVNKGNQRALEFTQRSRSVLFATLGLIVARMFDRNVLSFYENGIVSINLPIAEHVLGARASRTTHPRVLQGLSRLFSLLLAQEFSVQNPYLWKTKSEVVQVVADTGCSDLISKTLSCTRVRYSTRQRRHCGVCSQCVDRRFAVLAAGLGAHEAPANYEIDLFTGAHERGGALTMMVSYVDRAQKLRTMSAESFAAAYGQIFRVMPHLPGTADDNLRRIWDLHRRHGEQVTTVVDKELQGRATLSGVLKLPPTSLLGMILSPLGRQAAYADPVEQEPTAAEQAASDRNDYRFEQIAIAIDLETKKVLFGRGIELGGSDYELIAKLAEEMEKDLNSGTFPGEHQFIRAKTLAQKLGIQEQSLRQRISRARSRIEELFLAHCDRQLSMDDVIENADWNGYRLNSHVLLVNPSQLRVKPPASRLGDVTVTGPARGR